MGGIVTGRRQNPIALWTKAVDSAETISGGSPKMDDEVVIGSGGSGRAILRHAVLRVLVSLARIEGEVALDVEAPITQRTVLDALEAHYLMLRGTTREQATKRRRPFIRCFACGRDLSDESLDAPLPDPVVSCAEPHLVIGAIAAG